MKGIDLYNYIINPPKECFSVRMDIEGVKVTDCISWEVIFYDKNLKKNKFTIQFHPNLDVVLDNFKNILLVMGYDNDLSQYFRTQEELNHIRKKIHNKIYHDEKVNFEFKTICKDKTSYNKDYTNKEEDNGRC